MQHINTPSFKINLLRAELPSNLLHYLGSLALQHAFDNVSAFWLCCLSHQHKFRPLCFCKCLLAKNNPKVYKYIYNYYSIPSVFFFMSLGQLSPLFFLSILLLDAVLLRSTSSHSKAIHTGAAIEGFIGYKDKQKNALSFQSLADWESLLTCSLHPCCKSSSLPAGGNPCVHLPASVQGESMSLNGAGFMFSQRFPYVYLQLSTYPAFVLKYS